MAENLNAQCLDSETLEAIREEISEEIADLEEYARLGKEPPRCKGYRYKLNGDPYTWMSAEITGRQVLQNGNCLPVEDYKLRVKLAGKPPEKVALDEVINLRHPGIEKFTAIRQDQTEG